MKPHFPILDGLRGTAAILVVIFHLLEGFFPDLTRHPMHHGFLAVDFFFLLSGFVVGYAYDDRWKEMTVLEFFKIRLVRLHPLVILSVALGTVVFWFDPFTEDISIWKLLGTMLISFTLLPSPDVRGWNETHSINGPCWSLFQEYIANFLYAMGARKLSQRGLRVVVLISAAALVYVASSRGDVGTGWGYDTFGIAVVRMMFPFFAGLLLYRSGKLIRIKHAYIFCSLALILLFFMPWFKFNGLYEAFCIIVIFPVIVAAGAGGSIDGRWARVCNFSGAISYPIYIMHYPFIYGYTAWIATSKPDPTTVVYVAIGLFILFISLAYGALRWYDEPVRAWLRINILGGREQQVNTGKVF